MTYTLNDVHIDKEKFTVEDAIEAAEQIFSLKEDEFQRIKNEKWYHHLLQAVTFGSGDRKKIISDITSLSKLLQIFMLIYAKSYKDQSSQLDQIINNVRQEDQMINKLYRACIVNLELSENLACLNDIDSAILQLFLMEYKSVNGKEDDFKKYRANVVGRLGGQYPVSDFKKEQLGKVQNPRTFYRCACELCAIDGDLENREFPPDIEAALEHLTISLADRRKVEKAVLREADSLGIDYIIEKYKPNYDLDDDIETKNYIESVEDNSKSELEWEKCRIRSNIFVLIGSFESPYMYRLEDEISTAIAEGKQLDEDLVEASQNGDLFGGYDNDSFDGENSVYVLTDALRVKAQGAVQIFPYRDIRSLEITQTSLKILGIGQVLLGEIKRNREIVVGMLRAIRKFLIEQCAIFCPSDEQIIENILKRRIKLFPKKDRSPAPAYSPDDLLFFDAKIDKRLTGALHSYARKVKRDEVIAFIDTSLFGNGKDGILFSTTGLAFDYAFEKVFLHYNEISRLVLKKHELEIYGYFSELKDPMRGDPMGMPVSISDIWFNLRELKEGIEEILLYAD